MRSAKLARRRRAESRLLPLVDVETGFVVGYMARRKFLQPGLLGPFVGYDEAVQASIEEGTL
jgi:hypothetical protein